MSNTNRSDRWIYIALYAVVGLWTAAVIGLVVNDSIDHDKREPIIPVDCTAQPEHIFCQAIR